MALCNQQNLNTLVREKIIIAGKIEHPINVLHKTKGMPNNARIVYIHIAKNIIIRIYFKHNNAHLCSVFNAFI